jgi:tetratricopeptide (TPR) repeat protein
MLLDRPVFGYGPDNFSAAFPTYRTESEPSVIRQSLPTSAHSWAAQLAATSGVTGLAAFVAIAVVAIVITINAGFRPVAWMAAAMLGAFLGTGITTVSDVGTDWLFWASAGGVVAATKRPRDIAIAAPVETKRRATRRAPPPPPAVPSVVSLACAALGFGLIFASGGAYGASHSARDSQRQRLDGRPQLAVEAGLRATNGDPGRPEYWNSLGLAYISAQRISEAISAFDRAASLEPYNVRFLGDLTSAYLLLTQRGDASAATRAREVAERAVRADPNNPQANLTRAIAMEVTGDLDEARRSVERALALDPRSQNADLYLTAARVYAALGRPADTVRIARAGIPLISPPIVSVPLRLELGRALLAVGQPNDALAEIDAALAIQPNQPSAVQLRDEIRRVLQK